MAIVTSRVQLGQYCLRRLGSPVIQINVSDDQIDDRIDEALSLYFEQHYDGSQQTFYKYLITDIDKVNGYITLPDNLIGVSYVYPVMQSGGRVGDIFDIQYQIALNDLYNLTTVSIVPYAMTMTHLSTLNELLVGRTPFEYSKVGNKLTLHTNWKKFNTGEYLLLDAFMVVDPEQAVSAYKDRWLLKYATALIKRQWGDNLSKFSSVQLAGGTTLNGPLITQQAEEEIEKLEAELITKYKAYPMDFLA